MATGRIPTTANSPLTAKGDIFTYSTGSAKLAVGNDGETIVADSSTSTGLRWQGNFSAGKNEIINGDFGIWQRGTTFTPSSTGFFYTADRWVSYCYSASTNTVSQQAFTVGTAPATPYESQYFIRVNSTNTLNLLEQRIENVRNLANQSVTISFYAKSASAQTITIYLSQVFGSGGSAGVDTLSTKAITTSWARYSVTLTMPSISGKTIGTGSYLANTFTGAINNALDIWGVQVEAGSVATAFQTATGTIQGELAACQRYYYRTSPNGGSGFGYLSETGIASSTTKVRASVRLPVTMRVAPTSVDFSTIIVFDTVTTISVSAVALLYETTNSGGIELTVASGLTQYRPYTVNGNASTSAYLGFNAEL